MLLRALPGVSNNGCCTDDEQPSAKVRSEWLRTQIAHPWLRGGSFPHPRERASQIDQLKSSNFNAVNGAARQD
jgi:hypothetical protein